MEEMSSEGDTECLNRYTEHLVPPMEASLSGCSLGEYGEAQANGN